MVSAPAKNAFFYTVVYTPNGNFGANESNNSTQWKSRNRQKLLGSNRAHDNAKKRNTPGSDFESVASTNSATSARSLSSIQ